ncbi:SigE family RNA polymerase sigma factor [Phycicoccus flavus]|uniref:DNA-directed RNA polymerase specialized sigma subunit, sigma24 family n=1 Tax=Phycicoccus flavus TaxID=2502783 RepID=A0A8T6R432_9MICO|nr:hypothetical protein [Phycicoccus flavus]NHA68424.1 hypothetical protein [Phycicoccus flavus]
MTGEGAGPVDDEADFVDFAAACQGSALRAATLVTGDGTLGREVALDALRGIAADWGAARDEGPERRLRSAVLRRAVVVATDHDDPVGPVRLSDEGDEDDDAVDEPEVRRAAVRAALAGLPPRTRAVAVSRWLEDRTDGETADHLGVEAAVVAADVDAARRALARADDRAGPLPPEDDRARDLLTLVADEVPEADLARPAWDAAVARRRTVRRRAALAGGVLVLGGAAGLVAADRGTRRGPAPAPSRSAAPLAGVRVQGAEVLYGPEPDDEESLPPYPDAAELGLRARLGPGADTPLEQLPSSGSSAPVAAVFLLRTGNDEYKPAVLLPARSPRPLVVPMAPLRPVDVPANGRGVPVGPDTIERDRHRLVFVQPDGLVVLEVRSTRTRRIPMPGARPERAGWAADGRTVVVTGSSRSWQVDSRTGVVRPTVVPVGPGWADIDLASGTPVVRGFSPRGEIVGVRSLDGPETEVSGFSASSPDGWACRLVRLGAPEVLGGRTEGLLAARRGGGDTRVLAASTAPGVMPGAYRPLAWGPQATVVFESRSAGPTGRPVLRVLAWDLAASRLYLVGTLDTPAYPAPGFSDDPFTGVWTL